MSQLDQFRRLLGIQKKPRERRAEQRSYARYGLRVLIVDDSPTVVAALSHMLGQDGYQPSGVGDAETALERVASEPPELIFLDIVLPGMNGFAALRRLRRDPDLEPVPVIMISGNPQAVEEFYLKKIGADGFMKKPFGRNEVFTHIERLVRNGALPARAEGDSKPAT